MSKELSPEAKAKIPAYREMCLAGLNDGTRYQSWNREDTVGYVHKVYELAGLEAPIVLVTNNPKDYHKAWNALFGNCENDHIWDGIAKPAWEAMKARGGDITKSELTSLEDAIKQAHSTIKKSDFKVADTYWVPLLSEHAPVYLTWYKFLFTEAGDDLGQDSESLLWLQEKVFSANIAKGCFAEGIALVLRMPTYVHLNDEGLHNAFGPAIAYEDGPSRNYLNGRHVEDWIFDDYHKGELTLAKFMSQDNEDVRAAITTLISEREGDEGLMKFLEAELIDEKTIEHSEDYMETVRLYRTKESFSMFNDQHGNENVPAAWIQMACPSTHQVYMIPTCPTFDDAVDCMKWHRPEGVPSSVPYQWQSAN